MRVELSGFAGIPLGGWMIKGSVVGMPAGTLVLNEVVGAKIMLVGKAVPL